MLDSTAKNITAWITHEVGKTLIFDKVSETGCILCKSPRGGQYVITCSLCGNSGYYRVRSLLKVTRKNARYSWLITGGAGTNMTVVCGWDDTHIYRLSIEEWIKEKDSNYPRTNWLKLLGTGALPLPAHLDALTIREAAGSLPE